MTNATQLTMIAADFTHDQAPEAAAALAREHLHLLTLDTRGRDAQDFHELAVWNIKAALEAAFSAGAETALKAVEEAEEHAAEAATPARDTAADEAEIQVIEAAAYADRAERCRDQAAKAGDGEKALDCAAAAARNAQHANKAAELASQASNSNRASQQALEFAKDAQDHASRARRAALDATRTAAGWHAE